MHLLALLQFAHSMHSILQLLRLLQQLLKHGRRQVSVLLSLLLLSQLLPCVLLLRSLNRCALLRSSRSRCVRLLCRWLSLGSCLFLCSQLGNTRSPLGFPCVLLLILVHFAL